MVLKLNFMMIKPYLFKIATVLIAILLPIFSSSQFSACYAPASWTVQQVNGGNGSVNTTGAPASIVLTGPNVTGSNSYTHYSVTVPIAGTISFSWSVAHSDSGYDGFGYSVNGVNTQLTSTSGSGTTSVPVGAGAVFTFYGHSFDGCCGTFNATISNFTHPVCCYDLVTTVTNSELCVGDGNMTTLSATSTQGGSISWSGGISDGVPFMPPMGSTIYTATSSAPADCPFSQTVTLTNTPAVIAMVSDPTPCSGAYVTFTGSGATTYSWDNGVVDGVAEQVTGTGITTYTVTGTTNGCSAQDQVDIDIIAQPIVNAMVNDNSICEGDDVVFSSSGNATTYSWGIGITEGVPYTPTMTTTFNVVGTNSFGCTTTDGVTVTVNPLPIVSAGLNQQVCEKTMVMLNGSGAVTYNWNNGVTNGVSFMPTVLGTTTYEVSGIDANGCEGIDQVEVTVLDAPNIAAVVEHEENGYDGSIDLNVTGGTGSEYDYTWSHGFDDEFVWALTAGDYTVTVDDGTCSEDSTFTILNVLGIDVPEKTALQVYPNPVVDSFTLVCNGAFTYTVADANGRIIATGNGHSKVMVPVTEFAAGTYLLTVQSEQQLETIRLVKN
jgi:hypothetical protein